jgi:hypothetical protein
VSYFISSFHEVPQNLRYFFYSWYMGVDALHSNGITKKCLYLIKDKNITSIQDPLNKVRNSRILLFVCVQLLGFGAAFAITQTVGKFFLRSWN